MALKFIFSICVLTHLIGHVAGSSVEVEDCMELVYFYPEEAKGFAEVDATKEDLKEAIESITPIWDSNRNMTSEQDRAEVKAEVTSILTHCFEIRQVI